MRISNLRKSQQPERGQILLTAAYTREINPFPVNNNIIQDILFTLETDFNDIVWKKLYTIYDKAFS